MELIKLEVAAASAIIGKKILHNGELKRRRRELVINFVNTGNIEAIRGLTEPRDRKHALFLTIIVGNRDIFDILISSLVKYKSRYLYYAAYYGRLYMLKKLIERWCKVSDLNRALYHAHRNGKQEIVKYLLSIGAEEDPPCCTIL